MFIRIFVFLVGLALAVHLQAQNIRIDTAAYNRWYTLTPGLHDNVTPDGNYIYYGIRNQPTGSQTLVIRSTGGYWERRFQNCKPYVKLTTDSRRALIGMNGDSVAILSLGKADIKYISHVKKFNYDVKFNLLCYLSDNPKKSLVFLDLKSGKSKSISGISDYAVGEDGMAKIAEKDDTTGSAQLLWIDPCTLNAKTVWSGKGKLSGLALSPSGHKLVFKAQKENGNETTVWVYDSIASRLQAILSDTSATIRSVYQITDKAPEFTNDDSKVVFYLKKIRLSAANTSKGVNIWNYKDKYDTPEEQLYWAGIGDNREIIAVTTLVSNRTAIIDEDGSCSFLSKDHSGNYVLLTGWGYPDDYYNKTDRPGLYLISTASGTCKLLTHIVDFDPVLSPGERFVTWFDADSLCYRGYEIATGIVRNISSNIPQPVYDPEAAAIGRNTAAWQGIAGFLGDDRFLLVYGRYDIWRVDQSGQLPPANLTQGMGEKEHIVFTLCESTGEIKSANGIIDPKAKLVLGTYNPVTKQNGFWVLDQQHHKLLPGTMGDYDYYIGRVGYKGWIEYNKGRQPIKAKNSPLYVVQRMSASDAPNLFVTTDFQTFKPVSNINPAAGLGYNWVTSELVNWKKPDGSTGQGILYKPGNFNPDRKYPIIFTYYNRRSDQLNEYLAPDYSYTRIDIPTYVSNGYLVFVPDVEDRPGHNGDGVVSAVVSAAHYLSKFPYVDSARMGLMGHSFAGWETNYLITHSHLFAAAMEACGVSDQISGYNELSFGDHGTSRQELYEISSQGSPYGVGVTPWTRPDLYIANSPVLNVGNVATPLLMMHNRLDGAVPFIQGVEMFMAMKRAGKKVWMLEYDGEGHGAVSKKDRRDYTIRVRQFFDHYLEYAPAPRWMIEGVPAAQKGKDDGLELEPGREP